MLRIPYSSRATIVPTVLMAVWSTVLPIAGMTGLRNTILLILFIYLLWQYFSSTRDKGYDKLEHMPFVLLGLLVVLTLWIGVRAWTSPYRAYALAEFWGQWVKMLFIAAIGYLMVNWLKRFPQYFSVIITAIFIGLTFCPLFTVVFNLWWQQHSLWQIVVPTINNKTNVSYVTNLALAILMCDFFVRRLSASFLLNLNRYLRFGFLVGLLYASFILGARNGWIGFLLLSLTSLVFYIFIVNKNSPLKSVLYLCLGGLIVLLGLIILLYKTDTRWHTFFATTQVAVDIEHYQAWKAPTFDFPGAYPMPVDEQGHSVDTSNYQRVAWATVASQLIGLYPWGLGYGRDVFGWAIHLHYHLGSRPLGAGVVQGVPINSHSSVLELGLGIGLPGLLLAVLICLYLFWFALQSARQYHVYEALLLLTILSGYLGRALLDANLRDHNLELLFFMMGLLISWIHVRRGKLTVLTN